MGSKVSKEVQNSDKNTEIKHHKGDKLILVCPFGWLLEFSMITKTIVRKSKLFDKEICSIVKTLDNKSQFVCQVYNSFFIELDISTRQQVRKFKGNMTKCSVVNHNNKILIKAGYTNVVVIQQNAI